MSEVYLVATVQLLFDVGGIRTNDTQPHHARIRPRAVREEHRSRKFVFQRGQRLEVRHFGFVYLYVEIGVYDFHVDARHVLCVL